MLKCPKTNITYVASTFSSDPQQARMYMSGFWAAEKNVPGSWTWTPLYSNACYFLVAGCKSSKNTSPLTGINLRLVFLNGDRTSEKYLLNITCSCNRLMWNCRPWEKNTGVSRRKTTECFSVDPTYHGLCIQLGSSINIADSVTTAGPCSYHPTAGVSGSCWVCSRPRHSKMKHPALCFKQITRSSFQNTGWTDFGWTKQWIKKVFFSARMQVSGGWSSSDILKAAF